MTRHSIFRISALCTLLLAAASCVFPYEVDIPSASKLPFVVEGSIHIGTGSTITLSHGRPLNNMEDPHTVFRATGYIEGEDGVRVDGTPDPSLGSDYGETVKLEFDTADLRPDQRYRLHLDTYSLGGQLSNSYESDWEAVSPAPVIDGLSYSRHSDLRQLWIGLSMHCNGAQHFRWYFSEDWEYHSDVDSKFEYVPETREVREYQGPSLYYCWNKRNSTQILIFSTANQTDDRFEDLAFHRIGLSDKRLQVLYRITVHLVAMNENAYNYWYNMQRNSEEQGSIFAPVPSEMASNIHCISNPAVRVIGYLDVGAVATAEMYYDNGLEHFYTPAPLFKTDDQLVPTDPDESESWYKQGYLPFDEYYEGLSMFPTHYYWTPQECIDCRLQGGTKTKPGNWPNNHE